MTINPDIDKLRILLPHWVDHNDMHLKEMRRWRLALGDDAPAAADFLDDAIERMEAAGRAFLAALAALGEGSKHGLHTHGGQHAHFTPEGLGEDRSGE